MEKFTESPDIISRIDSEHSKLILEITLVDVEKDQINLMVNEHGLCLSAPSEVSEYEAILTFPSPVKPSETKARYADGYLIVEIPFKETLTDYTKISIE
jgi:HSP20 family molecular chaperone IbpA